MIQKGFTLWFTGLSGSGKTTVSGLVHKALQRAGVTNVEVLDGETVESLFSKGLGFTGEDLDVNTRRLGWVAHILTRHGVPNLVASVSPIRAARDEARRLVEHAGGPGSFVEVFVDCPVEMCEGRDDKGIYARARAGELSHVPGVDIPYEAPHDPELVIDTERLTPEQAARAVVEYLGEKGLVAREGEGEETR